MWEIQNRREQQLQKRKEKYRKKLWKAVVRKEGVRKIWEELKRGRTQQTWGMSKAGQPIQGKEILEVWTEEFGEYGNMVAVRISK